MHNNPQRLTCKEVLSMKKLGIMFYTMCTTATKLLWSDSVYDIDFSSKKY